MVNSLIININNVLNAKRIIAVKSATFAAAKKPSKNVGLCRDRTELTQLTTPENRGHPASILGKYLFGRRFEI